MFPGTTKDSRPTSESADEDSKARAARRVEAVINYMLQHLDKPLRVSSLNTIAGVSTSHFFPVFKSVTGFSPIDFFIRLRICCAGELLRNRNLSVKETAAILGYSDPFYFSRIFKLVTGVAPREYRKAIRNLEQEKPSPDRIDFGSPSDSKPRFSEPLFFKAFEHHNPRYQRVPIESIATRIQLFPASLNLPKTSTATY